MPVPQGLRAWHPIPARPRELAAVDQAAYTAGCVRTSKGKRCERSILLKKGQELAEGKNPIFPDYARCVALAVAFGFISEYNYEEKTAERHHVGTSNG
jgi:hypothetical protein